MFLSRSGILLLGVLFQLAAFPAQGTGREDRIEKRRDGIVLSLPGAFLGVKLVSDNIVRISYAKNRKFLDRTPLGVLLQPEKGPAWTLETTSREIRLVTSRLTVSVQREEGVVRFFDPKGVQLLSETPGGRTLEPAEVQGEKTFHVRQKWMPSEHESLYGLGQHQLGVMDLKGYDLDLWQHNTAAVVPFLVSSSGYGILWGNSSFTRFGDIRDFVPIPKEFLSDAEGRRGALTFRLSDGSLPEKRTTDLQAELERFPRDAPQPVRGWEGFLTVPRDGFYQFRCRSNGGIKVSLDGNTIMDHWRQAWLTDEDQARVHLSSGRRYPLRIHWDANKASTFRFLWKEPPEKEETSLWSEVGDTVDYTFVYGPGLDKVVAGYRFLTGAAPLMPSWAFGLWQSRNRYFTAQMSLDVVSRYRQLKLPLDNIVQDYQYWLPDAWGSHQFDPGRFPDPAGWIKSLHGMNVHLMISVWGKFYPGTDNFKRMKKKGYLYKRQLRDENKDWLGRSFAFYDAFDPEARKLFWRQVEKELFRKGVDAWWMDGVEPDLTASPPDRDEVAEHMNPTALGTGRRFLLGYPVVNSRGVYEGQRKQAPGKRVFILTRCAFTGLQRYASATWSGDITSTWTALAKQIPAGLHMSLSGIPYWHTDSGGYWPPDRFTAKNPDPRDEEEWRELNVRWFQYSTFCPLLRLHGDLRKREIWEFGGEDSPAFHAMALCDRLRYRMLPYLYSTAAIVTREGGTFLRPLVMDFPADEKARGLADEYLFGKAFLVAPVLRYKARKREVYLPPGASWVDFWTGRSVPPGASEVPAPYDRIPLYVRAGSIVPFGPDRQWVGEKPSDPLTLYVYAGADGAFTLYEDDGETYGYEKGDYAEIPFAWNDASKQLTAGTRKGTFPGMLRGRTIEVVFVDKNRPVGYSFNLKPDQTIRYDGLPVTLTAPSGK